MRSCPRTSPPGSLPALHSSELRCLVKLHHTVDFSVRVRVILARVLILALQVHRGDAEVPVFSRRQEDLATPVFLSIEFDVGNPAFGEPLPGEVAHAVVEFVARTIVCVEELFKVMTRCPGMEMSSEHG